MRKRKFLILSLCRAKQIPFYLVKLLIPNYNKFL